MEVGLIGLGTMGHSLALNIDEKGHRVHVFNRTASKTKGLVQERKSIKPYYSLKELVMGIKRSPRIIIMMITSGDVVDSFLEELDEYLDKDDIVIDGGNSLYRDTIKRNKNCRFNFVGCGISGGEEGARNGPSMMVGCSASVWKEISGLLESISAVCSATNTSCCVWFGEDGAGHFVKMVHNGIEYGDMAIISETYLLLKSMGLSKNEISSVFDEWNKTDLGSYLLEISSDIMKAKNESGSILDQIQDVSGQKGTGIEALIASVEMATPATSIAESVMSRMISHAKDKRVWLSKNIKKGTGSGELLIDVLKGGFHLARVVSYIQGCNLLMNAKKKYGWSYTIQDVFRAWSNGCILRGSLLGIMRRMGAERTDDFELASEFISLWNEHADSLNKTVMYAVKNEIPVPTISSCLMYLNGMKTENGSGNLIQAMRDYFGAHEVTLHGANEPVHIRWY